MFYVTPFLEGQSLRARLVCEKQLPVEDAVRIAREVADALDYARPLFGASRFIIDIFHTSYKVLPDGRGFIFARLRETGRPAAQAAPVQAEDWFADVQAKVGR